MSPAPTAYLRALPPGSPPRITKRGEGRRGLDGGCLSAHCAALHLHVPDSVRVQGVPTREA